MTQKDIIFEELKAIFPDLTTLNQSNIFIVPQGYFEGLAAAIIAKIRQESLLIRARSTTFQVPENYFETLSDSVLSKINTDKKEFVDELEDIAPLLNTISKKNIYTVPENYFKNLEVNKIKQSPAKIISFSFARRWVSYAAAAIIAVVLITGGFLYENKTNSFDVSKALNNFSDEDLHSYVDNNALMFNAEGNVLDQNVPDIKQELKIISDDELQQYLIDNSEAYLETPLKTN